MNFLKKKLKPLTTGLAVNTNQSKHSNSNQRDLEDDLYDEYVVEAPPHPSELIALGVDPALIDANDPDKLRELYKKAKEEGKDKKVNSTLLARQRQKEEIEERKKTREEWKYFDSLTSRIEQVVKDSQKNIDSLKESSAIDKLTEPDYELRLTPEDVIKFKPKTPPVVTNKIELEKINQHQQQQNNKDHNDKIKEQKEKGKSTANKEKVELDEFGCPKSKLPSREAPKVEEFVVKELLEDFGIDLRPAEEKEATEKKSPGEQTTQEPVHKSQAPQSKAPGAASEQSAKLNIDIKGAARPRPRPGAPKEQEEISGTSAEKGTRKQGEELDLFDTSFVGEPNETFLSEKVTEEKRAKPSLNIVDPFDTSYVNL